MAVPINKVAGPDVHPATHYMIRSYDIPDCGEPQFSTDYMATEFHGDCHTHIDALCHVGIKGKIYNGKPTSAVTSRGPTIQDITAYANGIVSRGVLLDIPRLRGVKWLEPGEAVTTAELEAAEKAQGVRLGEGDIFLFRTGHHRRRLELGPWNNGYDGDGKAGLHVETIRLLHERKVAAFFPDGDGETVPSNVEGVACPIHALQIASMGMACPIACNSKTWSKSARQNGAGNFWLWLLRYAYPAARVRCSTPLPFFEDRFEDHIPP